MISELDFDLWILIFGFCHLEFDLCYLFFVLLDQMATPRSSARHDSVRCREGG